MINEKNDERKRELTNEAKNVDVDTSQGSKMVLKQYFNFLQKVSKAASMPFLKKVYFEKNVLYSGWAKEVNRYF